MNTLILTYYLISPKFLNENCFHFVFELAKRILRILVKAIIISILPGREIKEECSRVADININVAIVSNVSVVRIRSLRKDIVISSLNDPLIDPRYTSYYSFSGRYIKHYSDLNS